MSLHDQFLMTLFTAVYSLFRFLQSDTMLLEDTTVVSQALLW